MKALFAGRSRLVQKLGSSGFICFAITMSFLTGHCIRGLLIFNLDFMLRDWVGYLSRNNAVEK
jgi:hypothetical protein